MLGDEQEKNSGTISSTIDRLKSGTQTQRAQGLKDLRHTLTLHRFDSALDNIKDKGFHQIFEAVFRCVQIEKPAYIRANKSVTRTSSGGRLSECAAVLRLTVELAVRRIRLKTVKALIDHIIDTLPVVGEAWCEPLITDYIKCLRTVLQYRPHIEHFAKDDWQSVVDFCLEGIVSSEEEEEEGEWTQPSINLKGQSLRFNSVDRSSGRSTPLLLSQKPHHRMVGKQTASTSEDLIDCLHFLTLAPNAPVLSRADNLLDALISAIKSSAIPSNAHYAAFATLNVVVAKCVTDRTEIARRVCYDLLRVIRHAWSGKPSLSKASLSKDEMLVTFMLAKPLFKNTNGIIPSADDIAAVDNLFELLRSECSKSREEDLMQIDDLRLENPDTKIVMGLPGLGPRYGSFKGETNWVLLSTIATLTDLLDGYVEYRGASPEQHDGPNKRQRLSRKAEDIFQQIFASRGSGRILALQLVPFLLAGNATNLQSFDGIIDQMLASMQDDNAKVASWTMVALASFACEDTTRSARQPSRWALIFQLASRIAASPVASRAACHLMNTILRLQLLDYSDITGTVESMISAADIHGPSVLTDTGMSMWTIIICIRSANNPIAAREISASVIRWVRSSWTLAVATDRLHTAHMAFYASPPLLLGLLSACSGRHFSLPTVVPSYASGSLIRNWCRHSRKSDLIDYLHLQKSNRKAAKILPQPSSKTTQADSQSEAKIDQQIIDLLYSKLETFKLAWSSLGERESNLSVDVIQIVASLCVVISIFTHSVQKAPLTKISDLQSLSKSLWDILWTFVGTKTANLSDEMFFTACLESVSSFLVPSVVSKCWQVAIEAGLSDLAPRAIDALLGRREHDSHPIAATSADVMEFEESFTSEKNQQEGSLGFEDIPWDDLEIPHNAKSFRLGLTVALCTRFPGLSSHAISNTLDALHSIDYFISLDTSSLLAARATITHFLAHPGHLGRVDASRLLQKLGSSCLQKYELERSEVAMCLCLDVMATLADYWTSGEGDDLDEDAADLYAWFIDIVNTKGVASPRVLINFALVLQRVLEINSTYTSDPTGPSARTILFQILHDGDSEVKFSISRIIPSIFSHFVLTEHDAIFDDVLGSLPNDPGNIEGIALRLFALAQLASQWHTLLRQSVYHLFETPAHAPGSSPYAQSCLDSVAFSKGLDGSRSLFRLFASQILYTWFESEHLESIPFAVFDYKTLKDLLQDVQDEVVSQIVMRGQEGQATELSRHLGVPVNQLLEASFYKVEAYSIARDISIPPSQGSQQTGSEHFVRKTFESDHFRLLVQRHFPQIVATLFRTLDQEVQIERAFSKRPNFGNALANLKSMTTESSSETVLPASQQPTFRARYLLDELEFLCKRAKFQHVELNSIWTPALFVHVSRSLLGSIHPALGPLVACSVLRKLRILVALAGDVALDGYPLEMLLHAVQVFLTDFHCSEDAIGLCQYLLKRGRTYLQLTPSFVAGLSISILASLRVFLSSSQESTTQESHFKATMSKARAFHEWLGRYLEKYTSPTLTEESDAAFRKLVVSAQRIRQAGSSARGTYESELIQELFEDQISGRQLLRPLACDAVLGLLCDDFQRPDSFRDDIIGDNHIATAYALSMWETLQRRPYDRSFKLWAARGLGRAYASTGAVADVLLREHAPKTLTIARDVSSTDRPHDLESGVAIIESLCSMLMNERPEEVGIAEQTLQVIFTELSTTEDFNWYEDSIVPSLMKSLVWQPYPCPVMTLEISERAAMQQSLRATSALPLAEWARQLALSLIVAVPDDPILAALPRILFRLSDLAIRTLPFMLHITLFRQLESHQLIRQQVSDIFNDAFRNRSQDTISHLKLILNTILYLREQRKPGEATTAERDAWLEVEHEEAAAAATMCRMHKTALLFLEMRTAQTARSSRRSSIARYEQPSRLLHEIFSSIDDPDFFYGMPEEASLDAVIGRLDYEHGGFKNLSFQSARFDSNLKLPSGVPGTANSLSVVRALNAANLSGIAQSMLSRPESSTQSSNIDDSVLEAALKLHQWDLPTPMLQSSAASTVYRAFQSLNVAEDAAKFVTVLDSCLLQVLDQSLKHGAIGNSLRETMSTLGVLTEIDEVFSSKTFAELEEEWTRMQERNEWMQAEEFENVARILESREIIFASIVGRSHLRATVNASAREAHLMEIRVLRETLKVSQEHNALQKSLGTATYLSTLIEPCDHLGLTIRAAVQYDLAKVLWDQGEMAASIRMLQQVNEMPDLQKQAVPVSRPELLATLGHHIAEARLEKPEEIINTYLLPAIKCLKNNTDGDEAGQVFHQFASFCDHQLQNAEALEDFRRIEKLRHRKLKEVNDLENMIRKAEGKQREALKIHRAKAKIWYDLDDREYQRLLTVRESLLQQSLENYLLSLAACDRYNNDVLRFSALWLDKADSDIANASVSKHITKVASRKLAPLMNQLSSRLLDKPQLPFQVLLNALVLRICTDHPYHGMYQIFASSKSKGGRDDAGISRHAAATKLADKFRQHQRVGPIWIAIHNASISFVRFATDRLDDTAFKGGSKLPLRKVPSGQKLVQDLLGANTKIPPPTIDIRLRADCDYTSVPRLVEFEPNFSIASGVSAPKIVTVRGSDGRRYKQLFKGGNDDLRQDSIMEQVFEQVSNLLRDHRATRRRNLGIRTYKVIPLTINAGIIEFVQDTVPLHDYLMPAHQKHFPKDMKTNICRKQISDAQNKPVDQRIQVFRHVTERFHPVMRYFFMERFSNPDDWFSKRLAYTRSTAAISILGHVLGLGDRHGHNILLDEKTGEVIHIDLGVAFEQGRVLPVPEVVPFRLTRDLVDGMGITKTEGVFRRCCEFTLEALRQDSYSIMTILDVLRYDPLYSWSVSPLRMKRMQESQEAGAGVAAAETGKANINEPSEADRALTVVSKKLGKSLSVTATVNELIQQATDERNLAVLYCGWAAYA